MNKTKIFILIGVIVLMVLSVLYILLARFRSAGTATRSTSTMLIPTINPTIAVESKFAKSGYAYPNGEKLLDSTGDSGELPALEITSATQRANLSSTLPLKTEDFTISMDYKRAKYVVTFTDSNNQNNKREFEQWLKSNYGGLKIEEFILK